MSCIPKIISVDQSITSLNLPIYSLNNFSLFFLSLLHTLVFLSADPDGPLKNISQPVSKLTNGVKILR